MLQYAVVNLQQFERDGFVVLPQFATPATCDAMLDGVVEITRLAADGQDISPAFVTPEANLRHRTGTPEELASKIFRLHREPVFAAFATSDAVVDEVAQLLSTDDIDC